MSHGRARADFPRPTLPARPEDFTFAHSIRVRLPDFDLQGHVNNAVYLTYAEAARVAYVEQVVGVALGESAWVLAEIWCRYLAPIDVGEAQVTVYQRLRHLGRSSLVYAFAIYRDSDGRRAAEGEAVQVHFDPKSERSRPLPDAWRQRIEAYEAAHAQPSR